MTEYVLVGGGAFAREIHDWFTPSLTAAGSRFVGYIDDGKAPMRPFGQDIPQLGRIVDYRPRVSQQLVMAIASPAGKELVAQRLTAAGGVFASLIHPTAWVSASARLGRGAVVAVFADISANAIVGDFVTINGYSSIGHDVRAGNFVTLSGYVDLTGSVEVGDLAFFGSGARVLPGLSVGARSTVGAGAVVMRSIPEGATAFAAPARLL